MAGHGIVHTLLFEQSCDAGSRTSTVSRFRHYAKEVQEDGFTSGRCLLKSLRGEGLQVVAALSLNDEFAHRSTDNGAQPEPVAAQSCGNHQAVGFGLGTNDW